MVLMGRASYSEGSYGGDARHLDARGRERRGCLPRKAGLLAWIKLGPVPVSSAGASKRTPLPGGDTPTLFTLESNSYKRVPGFSGSPSFERQASAGDSERAPLYRKRLKVNQLTRQEQAARTYEPGPVGGARGSLPGH